MPFRPAPKYRVLRLAESGEWEVAFWPEGEPAWRVCSVPERAAAAAIEDCIALAELDPESTFIAVCPEGAEIFRAEPVTLAAPF